MEELLKQFDECLEMWIDLPEYVYLDEYRNVFIKFEEKKTVPIKPLLTIIT